MKMNLVKEKAKEVGIKAGKKNKVNLIREIQQVEGNSPCFQTDISPMCDIIDCLWREDCKSAS